MTVKRNVFLIHPLMKLLTVEEKNGNSFHNYYIFLLKSDDHEYNKNIVFFKRIYTCIVNPYFDHRYCWRKQR